MKKLYAMLLCATALTYGNAFAQEATDETMPPPPPHMEQDFSHDPAQMHRHLKKMSPEERTQMGNRGKEAVKAHFTYKELASEFETIMKGNK